MTDEQEQLPGDGDLREIESGAAVEEPITDEEVDEEDEDA